MKTKEATKFFGGIRETSEVLNISYESVRKWGKYPPLERQFQLEVLTGGKLKADRSFAKDKITTAQVE